MENKPIFSRVSGGFYNTWGLAFILIFIFLFEIIFSFAAVMGVGMMNGLGFHEALNLLDEPDGTALAINMTRFTLVIVSIGQMLLPVLLFTLINRTTLKSEGGFGIKLRMPQLFLGILILALAIPLIDYITAAFQNVSFSQSIDYYANYLEHSREEQVNTILDMHRPGELILCLGIVALLPAIMEELLFRGVLMNIFSHMLHGKWSPVFLQAFVFAILHMSIYQFPGILAMGLLFGYIAKQTGSIVYGIILHFLFNATSVILYYLNHQEFDKTGVYGKYTSLGMNPLLAIAAFAGIVILLRLFYKVQVKSQEQIHE